MVTKPVNPDRPLEGNERSSSLVKEHNRLKKSFDLLAQDLTLTASVYTKHVAYLAIAEVAAALANNARRRADRRTDIVTENYRRDMAHRYGDAWMDVHAVDVRNNAAAAAGKDPVFLEHAAANEMYGRWSLMYSNLAIACSQQTSARTS